MKRREFIAAIGVAAAWPVAARAQSAPVIGFMHVASAGAMGHIVTAFGQGLRASGQNARIEYRWAEGRYERLAGFANEFARDRVAVIVTGGGEHPALAAKAATSTIPIVFNIGNDPVKAGLVASIGRPGGNLTGVNILTGELATKRLGLLNDLLPKGVAFAHVVNPKFPQSAIIVEQVAEAAQPMGREIVLLQASDRAEIDAAFSALQQRRVGGLMVAADPFFNANRDQIVQWVSRLGIPATYEQREFTLAGGLMSYSTRITDAYHQMGVYSGRILKGEKPADLPVVQAAKFELVVNMKTAKALGLTLPSGLLSIVDEVIE
jgi:putative ABC transport system substrate-binding protein